MAKLQDIAMDLSDLTIDRPPNSEIYIEIDGKREADFIVDADSEGNIVLRKEEE